MWKNSAGSILTRVISIPHNGNRNRHGIGDGLKWNPRPFHAKKTLCDHILMVFSHRKICSISASKSEANPHHIRSCVPQQNPQHCRFIVDLPSLLKSTGKILNNSTVYPQHKLTCCQFKIRTAGQFLCKYCTDFFS